MFEILFSDVLNPDHELICAARLINWDSFHETLFVYGGHAGRIGKNPLNDGVRSPRDL
jgi:hypothetical protein